tara:strand:+ start:6906 stop:8255 length:1350 start_codon:yes stop_codon:yes gene_type:complete
LPYETFAPAPRRKIAVIGSGIAGLSAAWMLDKHHDITVFESGDHVGGHSNTVNSGAAHGNLDVDTGFIVYNDVNYPNLVALFKHLDVPTKASQMSFGASVDGGAFEYAGTGLNGLLGQRRNFLNSRFWAMLADIMRFYKSAPAMAVRAEYLHVTLGDFLRAENYSQAFVSDHILPMGAAIWSTTARDMLEFPLASFVHFFESHGLLNFVNRPQWRTVDGGSKAYVKRLTAPFAHKIRHTGVRRVFRKPDGVDLLLESGERVTFDEIVIAAHADDALALLDAPSVSEQMLLGSFRYTDNETVLHSDERLMPKRRRVWSSWNYIGESDEAENRSLTVSYWMNELQGLDKQHPLFVTLNPHVAPRPDTVIRRFSYRHPLFDRAAMTAQADLWSLQGRDRTWFCGSYFGYGFHEDALQAGLAVGEALTGARRPWAPSAQKSRIHVDASLEMAR